MRALVIDDEPSIRLALRRFFVREGWEIDEADNGRVAIDKLLPVEGTPVHFDLIICDLRLPGYSGAELHAHLQAVAPALLEHLVMTTGDTVSADAADFMQHTACPVLQKPFELSELRALMDRFQDSV